MESVVAMLAILKTGAAYVPIAPANPRSRIEFILEDCAAVVVLVEDTANYAEFSFAGEVIGLTLNVDDSRSSSAIEFDSPVNDENLAYVMYTSGTSGEPKGVCIEHRSIR